MVLVDTSVWIDHFLNSNAKLKQLLIDGDVFCHPLIIGEIACGNIKNRTEILSLLQSLPQASNVDNNEVLTFIENNKIMGQGIGYIDAAILAATLLSGTFLWTLDKKLKRIAVKIGICYVE